MGIQIVTADERLSQAAQKTSLMIVGPNGVGKTSLLRSIPEGETLCIDLEAGLKAVQDWRGISLPIRTYPDFRDLACLIGGADPAVDAASPYSAAHYAYVQQLYAGTGLAELIASRRIIFVDSITDLGRLAMTHARQQPEAFSEKTGKPDSRGAYGLLAREIINTLKHLQRIPGRTIIFVGVLERIVDEFNRETWQLQMEGSKAAREMPGIVDQVLSLCLFDQDSDGTWQFKPDGGTQRRFVCHMGNRWGLPAKDRSGRLDDTEPADLGALLEKINTTTGAAQFSRPSAPAVGS